MSCDCKVVVGQSKCSRFYRGVKLHLCCGRVSWPKVCFKTTQQRTTTTTTASNSSGGRDLGAHISPVVVQNPMATREREREKSICITIMSMQHKFDTHKRRQKFTRFINSLRLLSGLQRKWAWRRFYNSKQWIACREFSVGAFAEAVGAESADQGSDWRSNEQANDNK